MDSLPALLLIDFQKIFFDERSPCAVVDATKVVRQARSLLVTFRRRNLPVIFTRHAHFSPPPTTGGIGAWWQRPILASDPNSELHPLFAPQESELLIQKCQYSAFFETPLEDFLRRNRVTRLILCGGLTHICVDTTAKDGFMRGFNVTLAADGCSSRTRELHEAALLTLSHAVASVTSVDMLQSELQRQASHE